MRARKVLEAFLLLKVVVHLCFIDDCFYSFSDANHDAAAEAIENMADAVTHARFVGTDPASDEVVLMKILQVWSCSQLSIILLYMC